VAQNKLNWQSKLVMLVALPFAAASIVLQTHWWAADEPRVVFWTLGLSLAFGLIAWLLRSATPGAAVAGATITAALIYTTAPLPFYPWRTALTPVLAFFLLTALATRAGRKHKERLGTAEKRKGREAAQAAANLGVAVWACNDLLRAWLLDQPRFARLAFTPTLLFSAGLAALSEAAADTVSSEIGQTMKSQPRMITTWKKAEPGTDGAISLGGTLAGIVAGTLVAGAGAWALQGGVKMFWIAAAGGTFGLFFDSLLGATLERIGWLNNDAVNFLSTVSAAIFALALLSIC
jgi:uncharacterized protein (TIGR00297 family)